MENFENRYKTLGEDYRYFGGYNGITGRGNSVLPPQAIPKANKTDKWKKACMNNLEMEGLRQYVQNLQYTDYYKMVSGEMVYTDLVEEDKDIIYGFVQKTAQELNLPSYLRHWDLMYPVVSKISGDYMLTSDRFRFDTTDDVSTNDYIRERTFRLNEFTKAMFESEKNKLLLQMGIDIKEDFESEEEYNQYQQQLEEVQRRYFPDKVNEDMKNFKTEAAQWAEKTWERDSERFRMNILESLEARDILLVGKSVRHYRIGYDHYYPEYWHPVETFHSKESSLTRIEDGEYAGRIKYYTVNELINLYGDRLSEKQRIGIYKAYFGDHYKEYNTGSSFQKVTSLLGEGMFERMMVPFQGYSDHKLAVEFEKATGEPQSVYTDVATGQQSLTYSDPLFRHSYITYGAALAQHLRHDYIIRTDTIQTTEAYWKGFKKVGLLSYRAESGYLNTIEVDEDILPEVIEQYNLKNLKKVSLKEYNLLKSEEKEGTIIWVDVPIVYEGIKIRASGLYNTEDIYFVEELPYQIKGEKGNIFNLKLPVCGHLGESFCKKIRPEQITYNYLLNQNQGYLEKEIGSFFVIDVNSLPLDYFEDLGAGEDALINLRNIAKTTGLLPTDLGRNNLNQNGGGLLFNPMSYQNATFTDQLQRNLTMANAYKWMAYEKLGLTPQSLGSPSQYMTNEGIQVGQKATVSQMYNIEQILMENKRANIELHMTVAQYCQLNNKDANYIYMASNNEIAFLQSIKDDPYFSLRKIDVRPIYSAKKAKEFMDLKTALIQTNTMGHDALSMTELAISDDFMQLKQAAVAAREYMDKVRQEGYANEQALKDKDLELDYKKHQAEINVKHERNQVMVQAASLNAMGRNGDNTNDGTAVDDIVAQTQLFLKDKELNSKHTIELQKLMGTFQNAAKNIELQAQKLQLDREKLQLEREKIANQKYIADSVSRNSVINKN